MGLKDKVRRRALKSAMTEVISEEKAERILEKLDSEDDSGGDSVPIAGADEDPTTLKEAKEEEDEEEGLFSEVRDDVEQMLDEQIEQAEDTDSEPEMPDSFDEAAENMRSEIDELDADDTEDDTEDDKGNE